MLAGCGDWLAGASDSVEGKESLILAHWHQLHIQMIGEILSNLTVLSTRRDPLPHREFAEVAREVIQNVKGSIKSNERTLNRERTLSDSL